MALLVRQDASGLLGATITFITPTIATGDTLVGGQNVHLLIVNGSGAPITATLTTPENIEGALAVADRPVTVTNGTTREIPVPSRYNDPVTGLATVICTAVTTITIAAVLGNATP